MGFIIMNKMKKLGVALFCGLSSALVWAQEAGARSIVSTDDVADIFTEAQTNMTALIGAALPVVIAFVGGGLIIWGALALVSLLKRGFGAGKGR